MARPDYRSPEAEAYRKFYNTAHWRAIRDDQLRRFPLCQRCPPKRPRAATVCNHLDPASKLSPATFFKGPFSSLCKPCHDAGEQKAEHAGFGGEADEDGWPTDSRHPANRRG